MQYLQKQDKEYFAKFTTDGFKETVFRKYAHCRNTYIERQKRSVKPVQINVKLQPSLIKYRIGLLKFANCQFEGAKNIIFAYADMLGS